MSYYYGNVTEETLKNLTSSEIIKLRDRLISARNEEIAAKRKMEDKFSEDMKIMINSCVDTVKTDLSLAGIDTSSLNIAGVAYYIPCITIRDDDNEYFKYSLEIKYKDGAPIISSSSWSGADLTKPESITQLQKTINILDVVQNKIDWSMLDGENFPKYNEYVSIGFIPGLDADLFNKAYNEAKRKEDLKDNVDTVINQLEDYVGTNSVVKDRNGSTIYNIIDETATHYIVKKLEYIQYEPGRATEAFKTVSARRVRKDFFAKRVIDSDGDVVIIKNPDSDEYNNYDFINLPRFEYEDIVSRF